WLFRVPRLRKISRAHKRTSAQAHKRRTNGHDQRPMTTMLPVLTAYEKEHIAERQPLPQRYLGLSDEEMDVRIATARNTLGRRLVILGHHYQRDEVIKFADHIGDSFKLARQVNARPDADFI